MTDDPLFDQLREQAQAFDPDPPPGMRRHVLAAVESLAASRARAPHGPVYWLARGGAVAVVIVLTTIVIVHHYARTDGPVVVQRPAPRGSAVELTRAVAKATDPSALAERFVDQPLEGELQNLMTDLGRAKDTITRALPMSIKRQRPATQPPPRVL